MGPSRRSPPLRERDELARESLVYLREKPRLLALGKEGKWILVCGERIDGDWCCFADAVRAGYDRFWPSLFMVRQVCKQEPVVHLPASLWGVLMSTRAGPLTIEEGAIIEILVAVCDQQASLRQQAGQVVPSPKAVPALIDPGATHTFVDEGIVRDLALDYVSDVTSATPGAVNVIKKSYAGKIVIQGTGGNAPLELDAFQIVETDFSGTKHKAIIGRQVLASCRFVYDGKANRFSLDF